MVDKSKWKESDINVDSLWIIPQRDNSGKHSNIYHGNFIPQIPYQLISRYTTMEDIVMELFSGSGTTLFECEKLNIKYIGYDINQDIIDYVNNKMQDSNIEYLINNCDVTDKTAFDKCTIESMKNFCTDKVDFLIAHPPYLNIVKFTNKAEDLSNISNVDIFITKLIQGFSNALTYLKKNGYFAIIIGDLYKNSEVIPLGFYVMDAVKKNFKVKLKGTIVKNIEGNRGKIGMNSIWRYRALMSDYYLFKHEYIFVFKKEF